LVASILDIRRVDQLTIIVR